MAAIRFVRRVTQYGLAAVALAAGGVGSTAQVKGAAEAPNLRMTNEVRIYELTKDAVVNISSTRIVAARVPTGDQMFDRFFGGQVRDVPAQSLGSGFVIHSSGYIVTNEHVIDEATEVDVVLSNGQKLEAQVVATDNEHDLAVLKVTPKAPLPTISLGISEDLMIGEPVCAIGNPFGYSGTMTRGIVSATNRTLDVSEDRSYKGLIQTDASINPGNSGGPLLNAYGQVVGVNTAIREGAHGIGFAISVSNVRDLLPEFLNPEAMSRASIGFTVEEKRTAEPPSTIRATVVVKNVSATSPAAKQGLLAGDRIVSVDKVKAGNIVEALVAIAAKKPGETVSLEVRRGEGKAAQLLTIDIPVTGAPPSPASQLVLKRLGIEASGVTPASMRKNHLAVKRGVLLSGMKDNSAAANAGLQVGDVIISLAGRGINTMEDLEAVLKRAPSPSDLEINVVRGNFIGKSSVHLE